MGYRPSPRLPHVDSSLNTMAKISFLLKSRLHHVYETASLSQMLQGKRVGLVCSCAPKACHGDVIAAKLVRMYCEIASP